MCIRSITCCALLACLFLVSCENDLRDIEKVSSRKLEVPVDTSKGVTAIFSDSAIVKGKLITPLLLNFRTSKPYYEMPKGLNVILYDANLEQTTNIVADNGIWREGDKLIELRKNVVVTTQKGDVFKSEELFWDQNKKIFYSNQLVNITKTDGTTINGTNFESDQSFNNPVITNATGNLATGNQLKY